MHVARVGAYVVSVLGVAASCATERPPLVIVGVLAPPIPDAVGTCLFTPIKGAPLLPNGVVDLSLTHEYAPVLLIGNDLVYAGDQLCDRLRIDADVILEGATVRIDDSDGNVLDSYTLAGDGFVSDSVADHRSLATYSTRLVSAAVTDKLGSFSGTKQIFAHVKVFGTSMCNAEGFASGSHVESNEFDFAITACFGCLCDAAAVTSPCVLGQDQPAQCP
jgi:hypothetical protein